MNPLPAHLRRPRRLPITLMLSGLALTCAAQLAPPPPGPRPAALPPPPPLTAAPLPTPAPQPGTPAPAPTGQAATRASVGEQAFRDTTLSAGGNLACASCHANATGLADPAGTFLPLGGPQRNQQGTRSSPSLAYLGTNTAFSFNADGRPHGGFFWDGRADTRVAQAGGPLLNPAEMANASVDAVAASLKRAPYYLDLLRVFQLPGNASAASLFNALTQALAAYQANDADFMRFNSRYDQFLDGRATLSAAESRGLNLFNDPQRGNCASCHDSRTGPDGARPLFTNFSYHALGLPRNRAISANADPNFYDMGLCGPVRQDLQLRVDLCGMFKVPTLRNVAVSAPYFHNASTMSLETAVSFYATRDIDPARWYPLVNGRPDKFNDLPLGFRGVVEQGAPFSPGPGGRPRLSPQDVADLVAFLRTLTDDLNAPAASARVGR